MKVLITSIVLFSSSFLANAQIKVTYSEPETIPHLLRSDKANFRMQSKLEVLDSIVGTGRVKFVFNSRTTNEGKMYTQPHLIWNDLTKQWTPYGRHDMLFDNSGHYLSSLNFNWNENTLIWDSSVIMKRVYDSILHPIEDNYFQWISGNWEPTYKAKYEYDSNGYYAAYEYNEYDKANDLWRGVLRYGYKKNKTGLDTSRIAYNWEPTQMIWQEASEFKIKIDLKIDSLTRDSLAIRNEWSLQNSNLIPYYRYEYKFDSLKRPTLMAEYEWHPEITDWKGKKQATYVYDHFGNRINEFGFIWDDETKKWNNWYKYDYNYDTTITIEELEYPFTHWYNEGHLDYIQGKNKPLKTTLYSWFNGWSSLYDYNYFYSENTIVTHLLDQEKVNNTLKIYPNPSIGTITIELNEEPVAAKLKILDLRGETVLEQSIISKKQSFELMLKEGIYIAEVNSINSKSTRVKLVIGNDH